MAQNRPGPAIAIIVVGIAFFAVAMVVITSNDPPTKGKRPIQSQQDATAERIERECKRQFGNQDDLVMSCRLRTTTKIIIDDRSKRLDDAYKAARQ